MQGILYANFSEARRHGVEETRHNAAIVQCQKWLRLGMNVHCEISIK